MYNISRIRKMLTEDACSHAIRSLVLSRLDYCNSLLMDVNVSDIERLQRVQNRAARVIMHAQKYDHATPLLNKLHWLPVKKRIMFKVALMVYKCVHNLAPDYLSSLLHTPQETRYNLRSRVDNTLLHVPRVSSKKGEQSFDFSGPTVWNSLPNNVRSCTSVESFKRNLKTYLFSL